MYDDDSIDTALYTLWELAMAIASIKHIRKMGNNGHEVDKINKDDLVTNNKDDLEEDINSLANSEESDNEDSIFIFTELLQHDIDMQSASVHSLVTSVQGNNDSEIKGSDTTHCKDFTQENFESVSLTHQHEHSSLNSQYEKETKTKTKVLHPQKVQEEETIIPEERIIRTEENHKSTLDDPQWFSSMVAHIVFVPDIPIEYSELPASMASHMLIKNEECFEQEVPNKSLISHQVSTIEQTDIGNQDNLMQYHKELCKQDFLDRKVDKNIISYEQPMMTRNKEDTRTNIILSKEDIIKHEDIIPATPHRQVALISNPELQKEMSNDPERNNFFNSHGSIQNHSYVDNNYNNFDDTSCSSPGANLDTEIVEDDMNNCGLLVENKWGKYVDNSKNYISNKKDDIDIQNDANSFDNVKNEMVKLKTIEEQTQNDERGNDYNDESGLQKKRITNNMVTTEEKMTHTVKGVEFNSCIVLHQYSENEHGKYDEHVEQTVKEDHRSEYKNYENKVNSDKRIDKNTELMIKSEKNIAPKSREKSVRKSKNKLTFNANPQKQSYKIRFKVKLGEDPSKPSALKYLLDFLQN